MTPEISEFSYGFALTNEIVGWTSLKAAPIFPSLIEEGKAGGGYDVKLDAPGVPLYLQFKRADCMTRRSAREISKEKIGLRVPFHRFPITQSGKSDQHSLLLELDDGVNAVFYAAPRFHELAHINKAWGDQEVAARSIFVRPSAIGPLDGSSHHVAYDAHRAYRCSEPKLIEFATATMLVERLSNQLVAADQTLRTMLPHFNRSLGEAAIRGRRNSAAEDGASSSISLTGEQLPSSMLRSIAENQVPRREPSPVRADHLLLRQLADGAMKLFDAQLVIVQKS